VRLLRASEALSSPGVDGHCLLLVAPRRPLTGEATVLPVLGRVSSGGVEWVEVMLPGRPNGRTGWIRSRSTVATWSDYAVRVETGRRLLVVSWRGHEVMSTRVVVGADATPTPLGEFFVEEVVALDPGAPGAPDAFALSARSDVLQEFDGGPGQIALHGLDNLAGTPGDAVSHGCVRLPMPALVWMLTRIGPGVRVTITS
jgi:lipoprotein-anchoring transpeptidase ErfK/SrfK